MRKPTATLNLYMPSTKKVREIRKKAKLLKKSVSKIVLEHFDSLPSK